MRRKFGISRVTGNKLSNRFRDCGLKAFKDRSRRPYRHANKLPYKVERTIVDLKNEYSSWGAIKIRDKLTRAFPMIEPPSTSAVHAVLDRHCLVEGVSASASAKLFAARYSPGKSSAFARSMTRPGSSASVNMI